MTGCDIGNVIHIPRVNGDSTNVSLPFNSVHRQFPMKTVFAIIINKPEGQCFDTADIYLPVQHFPHGQLQVGMSRIISIAG